jgi:predicted Zn-dependent protease
MAAQVESRRSGRARGTAWQGDPAWTEALRRALEAPAAPEGCLVFLEDRRDATILLDAGADGPSVDLSRTCGVAVQAGGGHAQFRSAPSIADVETLLRPDRAGKGATSPPAADRAISASGARLPVEGAIRLIEDLVGATQKLQPRAEIRAKWVGFDQLVHVGRSGREVVADRRGGRRVWLQADLTRRGRSARAVAEAVLPPDAGDAVRTFRQLSEGVAARVEARLAAETPASGERSIVFAPGVGGVLLHETVGHALEADAVLGRASWLAGDAARSFRGPRELVVVDDPRRGRASWRVDDEGEPARATALMREGRAVGWLHDRSSARASGKESTGHGRRSSFREAVRPRMGCTFLGAGRADPAEALEGIEDGVYVRRMEAASTDASTGRALFRVTDADRIRHGRIVAPLAPHVVHVDARAALASVDRVANDLTFDVCVGSCVHHGQPLSISVGAPTFRIGLTSVLS